MLVTGEVVKPPLLAQWFARYPAVPAVNAYGPSEAADDITLHVMTEAPTGPSVPIGRTVRNFHIHICSPDGMRCPIGIPGELWVSGPGVGRGYLNDPARTAAAFGVDPFRAGNVRLYRTGDLAAYREDGTLHFIGRRDYQVKIRGHRIELGDVEAALAQVPGIREVVVVDRRDQARGAWLAAYVVAQDGVTLDTADVLRQATRCIPAYMVPATCTRLEALPLSPNGKVDRKRLPLVEASEQHAAVTRTPRSQAESQLVTVWQDVLRRPSIGIDDNFFTLGGDSLLAMQVVARAARLGLSLTPRELFTHQTVAELVANSPGITSGTNGTTPTLGPLVLGEPQRRFFRDVTADAQHHAQAVWLALDAPLQTEAAQSALTAVVARHDTLRSQFRFTEGAWQVTIAPDPMYRWEAVTGGGDADAIHHAATALMAGFDLGHGPLMGALHVDAGADGQRLLLAAHHLVVDGLSWRVLLDDFLAAYAQARDGKVPQLAPAPARYGDWARTTTRANQDHVPLPLPAGLVRDEAEAVATLDAAVADRLGYELRRVLRTDPTDALVAATVQAVAAWRGDDGFGVSVEAHGRGDDGRFAETVGWFTHTQVFNAEGLTRTVTDAVTGHPDPLAPLVLAKERRRTAGDHRAPAPLVQVNYHGRVNQSLPAPWQLLPDPPGSDRSPRQQRQHPFEVTALVTARGLEVHLQYDRTAHTAATMQALVDAIAGALDATCTAMADAPARLTPGDVPQARLDVDALRLLTNRGVVADTVDDIYGLSPTQQGMLFHTLEDPASGLYVNQLTATLDTTGHSALDVDAFGAAWQHVTSRHPALRTTFHWEGLPYPVQVVHDRPPVPMTVHDWRDREPEAQARAWRALCDDDRARGFDVSRPPLQRLLLARLSDTTWHFCWTQHHLLLDGWSSAIVLDEVLQHYHGANADTPRPRPFRDAVRWMEQQERAPLMAFWRERLQNAPTPTPLPAGRRLFEGAVGPFECREAERQLSPQITAALQQRVADERITLSTLMQGAWALLLSRMCGETDVVFGAVVGGRPAALTGADVMIGVFINTIPVRVRVDEAAPLGDWLRTVQAEQAASEPFQYGALADIQRASGAGGGAPLFGTLLNVANYAIGHALQAPARPLAIREVHAWEPNNYPLTLVVTPGAALTLTMLYDAGQYAPDVIEALLARLAHLLATVARGDAVNVGALPFATPAETDAWRLGATATVAPSPKTATVWEALVAHAASKPEHVAVHTPRTRLTYRALQQAVERRANWLLSRGASHGARVLVELPRDEQLLVTMLACWRIAAVYVPVDPAWPAARRELVTARTRASVHVDRAALTQALTVEPTYPATLAAGQRAAGPDDLAYIIHTSGSTGVPKGALLAHDGLRNHVASMVEELDLGADAVVAQTASAGFDISLWQFCAALVAGGTTAIFDDALVLDPPMLMAAMQDAGVTVFQCVPSYLRVLLDTPELATLASLRWLVTIGEVLPIALVHRWFGVCPTVPLMNAYGPTEASDSVTHHVFREPPAAPVVPIGRPIRNMACYVLDDAGRLCAPGAIGEIAIAGVGVGRGYLFDDERTAAVFCADPLVPGRRLYRTGDLGVLDFNGTLYFVGRRDGQVKIRGHRLEIGEIEAALDRTPGLREAVVVVRKTTDGTTSLEACLVPTDDSGWTSTRLADALAAHLPRQAIPERVRVLPVLPRLASGKIDRRALAALAPVAPRALPDVGQTSDAPHVTPSPAERLVHDTWESVLGTSVAPDTDFFAAGGHSLHALQLAGLLSRASGVRLDVGDIFAAPTVRGQAALLERGSDRFSAAITRRPDTPDHPVSAAQQRLWLASRTAEGSATLHMVADVRLHGTVHAEAMQAATGHLLARHESLRTTFHLRAGALRQRVHPAFEVSRVFTAHHAPPASDDTLRQTPFALDHGPLLRLHLWPESSGTHRLLLMLHHIVGDAESLQVLVRDLLAAYAAARIGAVPDWEPLTVHARDVTAWLAERADATRPADEAYWRRTLRSAPTTPELPRRAAAPHATDVTRHTVSLSHGDAAALRSLARDQGTTVFSTLAAATAAGLYRLTGAHDLVLGTQQSRRQHPVLGDQVGLLIDSVPLRVTLQADETPAALLRRTARVVREAVTHSGIGFDRILDIADVPVQPGRSPLFEVVVQYITETRPTASLPDGLRMEEVDGPHRSAPYPLVVEATDAVNGSLQIEIVADAAVDDVFVREFTTMLAELLRWLTAQEPAPLPAPVTRSATPARPKRPRIALDLS
jgi:amino acid adenylation domain-containing protein/non-ribosomal peptide synthase protein (TIGR01720 family)